MHWDEELPPERRNEWIIWLEEMKHLNYVTFERSLTPDGVIGPPSLCIFCDASVEAFGTCAYMRWKTEKGFVTRFVAARSRVAPLKPLTMPRLELQAAVLMA